MVYMLHCLWVYFDTIVGAEYELEVLPNTTLCAWRAVRPNKPKRCSLEERKAYYKAKQEQVVHAQKTWTPRWFLEELFFVFFFF